MRDIGLELDNATSALSIDHDPETRPAILDLCMAPGGFSAAALERNPSALLRGISLPRTLGGHEMLLRSWSDTDPEASTYVDFRDITLLAEEMGTPLSSIPAAHPDAASFSADRPFLDQKFDLVFCDGQVLRTHERPECMFPGIPLDLASSRPSSHLLPILNTQPSTLSTSPLHPCPKHNPPPQSPTPSVPNKTPQKTPDRQNNEPTRLTTSQLTLALTRLRPGGTLVMLLHKADAWPSVRLIHTLWKLAGDGGVVLHKPRRAHKTRSSFYVVARGVRVEGADVEGVVEGWRGAWRGATFGGFEGVEGGVRVGGDESGEGVGKEVGNGDGGEEGDDGENGGREFGWEKECRAVLEEFGETLAKLTEPVFAVQAEALKKAPWMKNTSVSWGGKRT